MWQLFSFVSILFGTIEETVNKASLVGNKAIDIIGATWLRNAILLVITFPASWLIEQHAPHFVVTVPILILGILYAVQAVLYTNLLRNVEITASSLIANFIPIIFLPIDIFVIGAPFLTRQIVGVVLLVFGGALFFFKRSEITRKQVRLIALAFLLDTFIYGLESYSFQSLFNADSTSVGDFMWSMWSIMVIVLTALFILVCLYQRALPQIVRYTAYARGSTLAMSCDYVSSFFFLHALTLASVSRVASMASLYPLILIAMVIVTQKRFGIELEEYLERRTMWQKIAASIIVCIGIYLVR
jgi:drug/metabolite transporter (DMT)-like permease